jgi:hypothetical protein
VYLIILANLLFLHKELRPFRGNGSEIPLEAGREFIDNDERFFVMPTPDVISVPKAVVPGRINLSGYVGRDCQQKGCCFLSGTRATTSSLVPSAPL